MTRTHPGQRRGPTGVASPQRVGILGFGSIGRALCTLLQSGAVPGMQPVAVVARRPVAACPVPQLSLPDAIDTCDIVVECAGHAALAQHGEQILAHGVDLLVSSVGALVDTSLADKLHAAGPGRLLCTAGAIGGIDLLAAAARGPGLRSVRLTTTKKPLPLIQPWMDGPTRRRLRGATRPLEVFRGAAREAARKFPRSLNVAATVALAVGRYDLVEVSLWADPDAAMTTHVIEADGDTGTYRFEIANQTSPENPRTSAIVPHALVRSLSTLAGYTGTVV